RTLSARFSGRGRRTYRRSRARSRSRPTPSFRCGRPRPARSRIPARSRRARVSTYTPEEVLEQLGGLAASRLAGELLTENLPLNAHSNAAASSLVAKSGPGVLF